MMLNLDVKNFRRHYFLGELESSHFICQLKVSEEGARLPLHINDCVVVASESTINLYDIKNTGVELWLNIFNKSKFTKEDIEKKKIEGVGCVEFYEDKGYTEVGRLPCMLASELYLTDDLFLNLESAFINGEKRVKFSLHLETSKIDEFKSVLEYRHTEYAWTWNDQQVNNPRLVVSGLSVEFLDFDEQTSYTNGKIDGNVINPSILASSRVLKNLQYCLGAIIFLLIIIIFRI